MCVIVVVNVLEKGIGNMIMKRMMTRIADVPVIGIAVLNLRMTVNGLGILMSTRILIMRMGNMISMSVVIERRTAAEITIGIMTTN